MTKEIAATKQEVAALHAHIRGLESQLESQGAQLTTLVARPVCNFDPPDYVGRISLPFRTDLSIKLVPVPKLHDPELHR